MASAADGSSATSPPSRWTLGPAGSQNGLIAVTARSCMDVVCQLLLLNSAWASASDRRRRLNAGVKLSSESLYRAVWAAMDMTTVSVLRTRWFSSRMASFRCVSWRLRSVMSSTTTATPSTPPSAMITG